MVRTFSDQPERVTSAYQYAEAWEANQRARNEASATSEITLFLQGASLLSSMHTVEHANARAAWWPEGDVGNAAAGLHVQLVMLAARGMKPALDLLLGSYYSEAFAIERAMLEGWARAVYVRLRPQEYERWYHPFDPEPAVVPVREPRWDEVRKAVEEHGAEADRKIHAHAQLRWNFLNLGAHPSGDALVQAHAASDATLRFLPESDPALLMHGLGHGIFVQSLLLQEVSVMTERPPEWHEQVLAFRRGSMPLQRSVAHSLQMIADAYAAEAELRKNRQVKK
ncbi:MAG: hypothetical protein M3Z20_21170 [Chloroflexota bacterium]|nr:hypothetical protein [Chloroflexota bacterium]